MFWQCVLWVTSRLSLSMWIYTSSYTISYTISYSTSSFQTVQRPDCHEQSNWWWQWCCYNRAVNHSVLEAHDFFMLTCDIPSIWWAIPMALYGSREGGANTHVGGTTQPPISTSGLLCVNFFGCTFWLAKWYLELNIYFILFSMWALACGQKTGSWDLRRLSSFVFPNWKTTVWIPISLYIENPLETELRTNII